MQVLVSLFNPGWAWSDIGGLMLDISPQKAEDILYLMDVVKEFNRTSGFNVSFRLVDDTPVLHMEKIPAPIQTQLNNDGFVTVDMDALGRKIQNRNPVLLVGSDSAVWKTSYAESFAETAEVNRDLFNKIAKE